MNDIRSDRAAELALLSSCLNSKTARKEARKWITGRDFDDPRHETIWDAMSVLDRHKRNIDGTTLLAVLKTGSPAAALMPDLVTAIGFPDNVPEYAAIIRGWSVKRAIESRARGVLQQAMSPDLNAATFAAKVAAEFIAIRDGGTVSDDVTGKTVAELLEESDDEPDWLIPGLLERRDRLMLTGEEGLGKSHLLRQIALYASAGLDPFTGQSFKPIRAAIIDCENTWNQVRRKVRPVVEKLNARGTHPEERVMVDCLSRIDITRDRDLARIHQLLDALQPDIVVIGPLYRLVPRALQTDDDTAPVLAALDTIRDRGAAVLIEAHAGHAIGKGGVRDLRPRGSSSLLGWPEFGYGLRGIGAEGFADMVPWRGNREEREWPQRLKRTDGFRWTPHLDLYGYNGGTP